jgi:hypothetical protein
MPRAMARVCDAGQILLPPGCSTGGEINHRHVARLVNVRCSRGRSPWSRYRAISIRYSLRVILVRRSPQASHDVRDDDHPPQRDVAYCDRDQRGEGDVSDAVRRRELVDTWQPMHRRAALSTANAERRFNRRFHRRARRIETDRADGSDRD